MCDGFVLVYPFIFWMMMLLSGVGLCVVANYLIRAIVAFQDLRADVRALKDRVEHL